MIISAQTSGTQSTNSGSWAAIPGLSVEVPRGVGENVLLILNVPNPYAQGSNYPGGNFAIQVNGEILPAFATFTYNEQVPPSTGRMPTTLTAVVPLSQSGGLAVSAMWSGVRGSTVIIDSPATLSAVV
jgi:mannose-binding lectin